MFLILDTVLLSKPGAGKGGAWGLRQEAWRASLFPGTGTGEGLGLRTSVPWGHVIQGTFPASPSSLSGPQPSATWENVGVRPKDSTVDPSGYSQHLAVVFGPDSHVHPSC